MAKKFRDLRWAMSTEAQTCAREKAKTMKAELPLAELRQARYFSQEQLADELQGGAATRGGKNREKGRYIGGRLEIRTHFPDGEVRINQFEDLEKA